MDPKSLIIEGCVFHFASLDSTIHIGIMLTEQLNDSFEQSPT